MNKGLTGFLWMYSKKDCYRTNCQADWKLEKNIFMLKKDEKWWKCFFIACGKT